MIIFKRCIRAYYEKNGNFDGIEQMTFYPRIRKEAEAKNMKVEDYLYSILGYKHDLDLTAKQRYTYRRDFVKGQYDKLYRIFGVHNKQSLISTLQNLDCLGMGVNKPEKPDYDSYVRLVAQYLKHERGHIFNSSNGLVTLGDVIFSLSLLTDEASIKGNITSPIVRKMLKEVAPKIKYAEGVTPLIQLGTLYVPEELTQKEKNKILKDAVMEAAFSSSKISLADRLNVIDLLGTNFITLAEKTPENYLSIIDIAESLDLTVEELIRICGVNYIDLLEQVKTMNCTVELFSKTSVKVYSLRSENTQEFILCDFESFKYLYENDLLKSLTFDDGIAHVTTNSKIPVSLLFMNKVTNDLRR